MRWRHGLALALLALLAGCGDGRPSRVPISGIVTIDGKPLTTGYVQFIPAGSRPSFGKLDEAGRFTLQCYEAADGAVTGQHKVVIVSNTRVNETHQRWNVPRKFTDPNATPLRQQIDGPRTDLEIQLSWEGQKPEVEYTGQVVDD